MKKYMFVVLLVSALLAAGCGQPCGSQPAPVAKPAPAPPPPVMPKPAMGQCGPYTASQAYPCKSCGIIRLDRVMPSEVQLKAPFDYAIKVTNLVGVPVADVAVTENLDSNFKLKNASPAAQQSGNTLTWAIGTLDPRETKQIMVTGMATNADCLKHCATVTYVVPVCANVKVVEPKLQLRKTAPSEVLLCDPIPLKFVVSNAGTGAAPNVKITDTLPAGLATANGQRQLVFDAGTLAAGQSRQFSANVVASKTGKYVNKAVATSGAGLRAESQTTTVVRQPVLTISKTGPARRYLSRSIEYEITVANKGDAAAADLVVQDAVPAGTQLVSASNGGKLVGGKVVWNLGTLAPNRSQKLSVTVMASQAGTIKNSASATATCAEGVSAAAQTIVAGIPAILLEVIDLDDPIEVGNNTTYEIIATNQGSSPGTNISIVCTLEANMQYVSSSGATRGSAEGNKVTFAPLGSLAPKAKAVWRVNVKALKAGDVRFTVAMNSDQLQRPVDETEATHLYDED